MLLEIDSRTHAIYLFIFLLNQINSQQYCYLAPGVTNVGNEPSRTFYDLPKRRNAGTTYVETTFTASPGDIIEQQWPGSWGHPKQRVWLAISPDGKPVRVASGERRIRDVFVLDYLRGTIDLTWSLKERGIG